MKNLGNVLLWTGGLLSAVIAVWQFYLFVAYRGSNGLLDVQGGKLHLWLAICAALITCACVGLGIFRRINQTEEFHITS